MCIDVYHGTGTVNWEAVREAGHGLGICKVSQGAGEVDAAAATNVSGMRAAGVLVGVYHFADLSGDGAEQAAHAVNAAHAAGWQSHDCLPIALDLEPNPADPGVEDRVGQSGVRAFVEAFSSQYQLLTGHLPMIYGSAYFLNTYLGAGYGGHPLWLAHYITDGAGAEIHGLSSVPVGVTQPTLPNGWTQYLLWQWTQYGSCAGVGDGCVDISEVNGGMAAIAAVIGS